MRPRRVSGSSIVIVFCPPADEERIVRRFIRYYGRAQEQREKPMMYVWVALGGALGSVARYACSIGTARWLGTAFPWGTLFVNVAGSFAIGLLAALVAADGRPALGVDARAFMLIGILGGFTTFSSFSLETLSLARAGALGAAATNVGLSVLACLAAVWLGFFVASALSR
jgi:CrcB protein